jgi:hypothetical protein
VNTTDYFENEVLRKRPYLRREWCEDAIANYEAIEEQDDGRFRYWIFVPELGKYLRVVTLSDGETILNAFPDRNFRR